MKTLSKLYTDLIARYLYGEATPAEIQELEKWVKADPDHAASFSAYQKTWKVLENDRLRSSINLDQEWNALQSKLHVIGDGVSEEKQNSIKAEPEPVLRRMGLITWSLRIAALFLLLAVPSFFIYRYFSSPDTVELLAGNSMIETTLPDGTHVTLNTGACLSYPAEFEGDSRNVTLQGEGWFEVVHDASKPFIVSAENLRIRVVGTSFLVNTESMSAAREVILAEGSVKIYMADIPEKSSLLSPGDKAVVAAGSNNIVVTRNDNENFLAWKTRRMVFKNTPLNEVAALLTTVYHKPVRLSGDGLSDCRISATFDGQSLESVLNVLKTTLDLQIRNTGAGIELYGDGCNQLR